MAYLLNISDDLKAKLLKWGETNGFTTLSQTIIYILTQWLINDEK